MGRVKESDAGRKFYVHRVKTPFGEAALLWSQEGLRSLEMGKGEAEGEARGYPGFEEAMGRYFAGKRERFDFDLDLGELTKFEREVLTAARGIRCGEVRSYSWPTETPPGPTPSTGPQGRGSSTSAPASR